MKRQGHTFDPNILLGITPNGHYMGIHVVRSRHPKCPCFIISITEHTKHYLLVFTQKGKLAFAGWHTFLRRRWTHQYICYKKMTDHMIYRVCTSMHSNPCIIKATHLEKNDGEHIHCMSVWTWAMLTETRQQTKESITSAKVTKARVSASVFKIK